MGKRSGVHVIVLVVLIADLVRESAKKGLVSMVYAQEVMMMVKEKYALAVIIALDASRSARNNGDAAEKKHQSARCTVKRSTVYAHTNATVDYLVEIVRKSVQIMKGAASRRLDGANETARKGLVGITEHSAQKKVMTMAMISLQRFALVVLTVLHAKQR